MKLLFRYICVCLSVCMATLPKTFDLQRSNSWALCLTMEILDEKFRYGDDFTFWPRIGDRNRNTGISIFLVTQPAVHEKPPSLSHCTCTVRTDGQVICFCCLQSQNTRTCGTAEFQHHAPVLCRNLSHAVTFYVTAFVT